MMKKDNIADRIIQTMMALRSINIRSFHPNISFVKVTVLLFIQEKGQMTIKETAKIIQISMPSTSELVDDLSRKGLLKRIKDTRDRRVTRIKLTGKGKKFIQEETNKIAGHLKKMFSILSIQEQEQLFKMMYKIHNYLNQK